MASVFVGVKANPGELHFSNVAERIVIYHLMKPFQNPTDSLGDLQKL